MPDFLETQLVYASPNRGDALHPLHVRLFHPAQNAPPAPLMIWMHSGGFHSGSIQAKPHTRMGHILAEMGYASAFVQYRLNATKRDLTARAQAALQPLMRHSKRSNPEIRKVFRGSKALAATEDCASFLQWLPAKTADFRLSGRFVLGGSSAGAITVLNTLFLGETLGFDLPAIPTAVVVSGAFVYPDHYRANATRILAIHGPDDPRVPVGSIRAFSKQAQDQCTYIEAPGHSHGSSKINPSEPNRNAIARFVQFDRGEPLSLPASIRANR